MGRIVSRRPRPAAWIARLCGTGCIATTLRACAACTMGRHLVPGQNARRRRRPNWPGWLKPDPIRFVMGWCAGGAWICVTNWNDASVSCCTNARLARYWQSSATAGSRCARVIPRPTKKPRRRLKKLCRNGRGATSRVRQRQGDRNLVPGRSPHRSARYVDPRLGQARNPTACATRPTLRVGLFGAVCPQRRATAALVLPAADTDAMSMHLVEIGRRVAPGAHAALVIDGAGYHVAARLAVPPNITLVRLPPYAPELNPVENVWEYLRGNKLAITVFESYDDIVDKSCAAWRFFADDPERIASITSRTWATVIS